MTRKTISYILNLIVAITLVWFHVSSLIKQCFFENFDYRLHLNSKQRRFRLIFKSTKFCNVERRFLLRNKRFYDRSWKTRMKKKSQKKIIVIDVFWSLISISKLFFFIDTEKKNKFKTSKKFLVERRVVKIAKHQNFKIILKSFSRRSIKLKRFKLFSSFSKFENAFDDDSFLNINMINIVVFHKQANKTNKKKLEMFSMTLQQIKNIIVKTKEFSKQASNSISNFLKISNVKIEKFIRKCFEFLRKFKSVLNFKKIENLSIHDFYDHKIEFIDDFATLFKFKMYSLSSKKWETLEKYLKKNLKKKFISFSKIEKIVFIFFVVKFNE